MVMGENVADDETRRGSNVFHFPFPSEPLDPTATLFARLFLRRWFESVCNVKSTNVKDEAKHERVITEAVCGQDWPAWRRFAPRAIQCVSEIPKLLVATDGVTNGKQ